MTNALVKAGFNLAFTSPTKNLTRGLDAPESSPLCQLCRVRCFASETWDSAAKPKFVKPRKPRPGLKRTRSPITTPQKKSLKCLADLAENYSPQAHNRLSSCKQKIERSQQAFSPTARLSHRQRVLNAAQIPHKAQLHSLKTKQKTNKIKDIPSQKFWKIPTPTPIPHQPPRSSPELPNPHPKMFHVEQCGTRLCSTTKMGERHRCRSPFFRTRINAAYFFSSTSTYSASITPSSFLASAAGSPVGASPVAPAAFAL